MLTVAYIRRRHLKWRSRYSFSKRSTEVLYSGHLKYTEISSKLLFSALYYFPVYGDRVIFNYYVFLSFF